MSTDLIDQLDAYGVWLEEHCATVLRPRSSLMAAGDDSGIRDVAEVEVGRRSTLSSSRRLLLVATAVALVATALVALWSHRSTSTTPGDLPADPSGALFVLPPAEDGMALSDGVISAVTPDSVQTKIVSAMIVGRPDGDGFVDIVGITDSADRPGPPSTDSWIEIDTGAGTALVSAVGTPMALQQRGDRWIRLTNAADEPTIAELLPAITLTAEGIAFEPVDGFVEVEASSGKPAPEPNTSYTAAFTDGTATFTVSTATASSPLFAALLAAERVEAVTISGHDGLLVSSRSDGGTTHGLVWQATPNRVAGVSGNATDEQLVDFAERLRLVDEEAWTKALPGYSREGP